jgi:pSer/pThr/pTyr-binding forkhead associated (FHA) protein
MSGYVVLGLRILLIVGLYAFLIVALSTIWRDFRQQSQDIYHRRVPAILITPLDNDDSQVLEFAKPEIIVGRDQSSDYLLVDDAVSSRHVRLAYHHNQWWVEDLQSTNGTFLNDDRIYTPTVVISGDELRCGKVNLLLTISDKPDSPFKKK